MSKFLRGLGGTVLRVVPAVIGGYFGGSEGAMQGYSLGASISDEAFPIEQKLVKSSDVSPYSPDMAYQKNPNRVTDTYSMQDQLQDIDKFAQVSDAINTSAMGSGMGSFGGKLGNETNDIGNIADKSNKSWKSDMGSMTKKLKTGGLQSQDLSGINLSLDETSNMINSIPVDLTGASNTDLTAQSYFSNMNNVPTISNAGSLTTSIDYMFSNINSRRNAAGLPLLNNTSYGVIGQQ